MMMRILTAALLFSGIAHGQATAYTALGLPDSGGHQRRRPLLRPIHAGALTLQLEGTTLPDVQRAFGGQLRHGGDAGGAVFWLCYAGQTQAKRPLLYWFLSNAEMSTEDHSLSEVALQLDPPAAATAMCDQAPPALTGVTLAIPGIGAPLADVVRTFGKAVPNTKGFLTYSHAQHLYAGPVVLESVTYRFKNGMVATVSVSQVTSELE